MAATFRRLCCRRLPVDRHSGVLNTLRLAKGFLASAEMTADERYRSYLQVLDREAVAALLIEPGTAAPDPLERAFAAAGNEDELNRMFAVDAETQLPDDLLLLTDKMSMAVSLECRVPLLDHQLVELAAAMPASRSRCAMAGSST
jgi:asparagine synthase (glutamine-hydrolysing)